MTGMTENLQQHIKGQGSKQIVIDYLNLIGYFWLTELFFIEWIEKHSIF